MKNTVFLAITAILASASLAHGQSALNGFPSRVVGQRELEVPVRTFVPNIVEGRELNSPFSAVVDRSRTPAALYVADTFNHRVLGWRNAANFRNGDAADIVIGQRDFTSTTSGGPGTARTIGLNTPIGLTVDRDGNLYVSDNGNNRILRFPKPFDNDDVLKTPDMVIGQTNFAVREPNLGGITASTLNLAGAVNALVFDNSGNLWASDPLNNRVVRYPASALSTGRSAPAADLVVGQLTFTSNALPDPFDRLNKSGIRNPSGLVFDPAGRLYVTDDQSRVLVFSPPTLNGQPALRILGTIPNAVQGQPTVRPGEWALQNPEGLAMAGNNLLVADRGLSRVVRFDPFETWAPETPTPAPQGTQVVLSPPIKEVIGQFDLNGFNPNRGLGDPTAATLNRPAGVAVLGNEIVVADTNNNRVVVFPTFAASASASRVLGQPSLEANAPNQLEGRELFLFSSVAGDNLSGRDGAGVAVDATSNPPILYIADTFNNRILGYRDARRVRPGDRADIVIGQPDFTRSSINSPQGLPDVVQDVGLFHPSGLAVDSQGNLWVADSGNGRVLRYAKPLEQQGRIRPNLVIGQQGLFQKLTDVSNRNMGYPFGIAFTVEGHLLVSDVAHNRVLLFRRPAGGDFTNFQQADRVIGQPDFFTSSRPVTSPNRLIQPRGIAVDTDDRLYVVDAGNRIVIYNRIVAAPNDPTPAVTVPGLNGPQSIWVSALTGEIWVADTTANRALRFPRFDLLSLNPASDFNIPISGPLALAQDNTGNLYVAEASNRVAIYFNGLSLLNTANYHDRPLAPGMVSSIYPQSPTYLFGGETAAYSSLPLPTTLAGIQVLVNEKPAPLYFVSPGQINFMVPTDVPIGSTVEYQVVRQDSGAILAVGQRSVTDVNPALFVQGSALNGQIAALNQDNSVNSPQNPISRGQVIQLFGTGQGIIPNGPADGAAPTGQQRTPYTPQVIIGTAAVPDSNIEYSGLAPGLPGVWQINVRIPDTVAPNLQTVVAVRVNSILSNRTREDRIITTTIAVRQ